MPQSSTKENQEQQYPGLAQSLPALCLLLLAYIFSFIDRNIMAMLIKPIRQTFEISDFQYSLLHGVAFTIFYIALGLPIGRLADSHNRTRIIAVGVFLWSIMTCLCGLTKSFVSLFFARMGVGIGEAALSPPAYSLLSDLFSPQRLRWATSIFAMGITVGGGLAYIVGGHVYSYFASGHSLPGLSSLNAWQLTFVCVGVPGVLIAVLIGMLREPARHQVITHDITINSAPPISEIKQHLKENRQSYFALFAMVSLMSVIGYGNSAWYPEFLQRSHGLSTIKAGDYVGWIAIIFGSSGMLLGASFATYLQKLGYEDANVRTVALIATVLIIPAPLAPIVASLSSVLLLSALVTFIHYAYFGLSMAAVLAITPNRMRALVTALLLFMANLFGLAMGPSIVAALTDFVFQNDLSLRYSLSAVAAFVYPSCAILMFWSLKHYRRSLAQFESNSS